MTRMKGCPLYWCAFAPYLYTIDGFPVLGRALFDGRHGLTSLEKGEEERLCVGKCWLGVSRQCPLRVFLETLTNSRFF
jgi:hypothetical protein